MTEQEKTMSEQSEDISTKPEGAENITETKSDNDDKQSQFESIIQAKDQRIEALEKELQIAKKNESEAMVRARAEIDNVRKRVNKTLKKHINSL